MLFTETLPGKTLIGPNNFTNLPKAFIGFLPPPIYDLFNNYFKNVILLIYFSSSFYNPFLL